MAEALLADSLDLYEDVSDQSAHSEPDTAPVVSDSSIVQEPSVKDSDIIETVLANSGISDINKIKFADDAGNISERKWDELTSEEKYHILTGAQLADPSTQLDQEEINLINQLRSSGQSPSTYLANMREHIEEIYKNQNPGYQIDNMTDDELFAYDAYSRFGGDNITDEQVLTLLDNAKSDPDLYAKTIENLRSFYREREDDYQLKAQQEADALQEQEYNNFQENILNQIQSTELIGGLGVDLSPDDKNDLANFILTRDENGNSEFGKAMDDPRVFTQAAFWILKGPELLNEMSSQIKMAYERGLKAGQQGQSQLVFKNTTDKKTNTAQVNGAFALDVN